MAGALSSQLPWELANNRWAASLNPVLANPLVNGLILPNLRLVSGNNTIDHRLGRLLQGWIVIKIDGAVTIYDRQDANQMPELTLLLTTSGDVKVSLYVF